MSAVWAQINCARRGRPVALYLGKLTPPPRADLSTAAGRRRVSRHLGLLRNEVNSDGQRLI